MTTEATPATEQMDPDHVGSLTAGLQLDEDTESASNPEPQSNAEAATESGRDATKAINRGELDTLMKAKHAELGDADSNVTSERPTPGAGVISKPNRGTQDPPTREIEEEATQAVEETESKSTSSGFSLPRPGSNKETPHAVADDDGLDEDSFGDFSDEDLHAVVFGEDKPDKDTDDADAGEQTEGARVAESPSLDFSDISSDETTTDDVDEPEAEVDDFAPAARPTDTVEPSADENPLPAEHADEVHAAPAAELDDDTGAQTDLSDDESTELSDYDTELPDDFPDYQTESSRPLLASVAGYLGALCWIIGGALAMFTSLPSPWDSMIPPIALSAGIVMFLLVLVGPPKWVEASILALLGIGIGGFAFVQWTSLGTVSATDILGMAPLIGAALALVAAIATLIRPTGRIEDV